MGRSVDHLSNATEIMFLPFETEDEFTSQEDWNWFKDDITERLIEIAPSLTQVTRRWNSNEVRIILENDLVEVGLSEYCGLASVSIRPNENRRNTKEALANKWISQIWPKFIKMYDKTRLNKIGTFSNGEGVYELIK